MTKGIARAKRLGLVVTLFAAGFVCGTLTHRSAEAQLGDVMKKAGESGALGSVGEMGTAILDMQKNVDGLQKNLDTFKKVKAALGG
ncbi:MAG TPA: hypothetical protein VLI07_05170 [Candidatus Binatus sp.]|jgi:hypothetical protein|nr:hypothetical protein [Candidatus Binatus sp.]